MRFIPLVISQLVYSLINTLYLYYCLFIFASKKTLEHHNTQRIFTLGQHFLIKNTTTRYSTFHFRKIPRRITYTIANSYSSLPSPRPLLSQCLLILLSQNSKAEKVSLYSAPLILIRPFLRLAHCFRSAYSFCFRRMARLRGSSKILPLNTRRGTAKLFPFLCLSKILFVPIMIYSLYIVIFIKQIKNTIHFLDVFLTCQLNICLRNHCNLCGCHYYFLIL